MAIDGMGVVELDRDLVGQQIERFVLLVEAREDVLQRGADEEILLLQPQLAPHVRRVVRVEHLGEVLRLVLLLDRLDVVALLK